MRVEPAAEPLGAQIAGGDGQLLAGDLPLVVLKAVLEYGFGYVVTSFDEALNPIDAVLAEARSGVLQRHGVLVRRLRRVDAAADVVRAPGASSAGDERPMRGLVVWHGLHGVRPSLERFAQVEVPGPVVVLCFEEEAAAAHGLPLLDPEPTAAGVVGAIGEAVTASRLAGRPVFVLLRPRARALRGVMRCRDNMRPAEAQEADAAARLQAATAGGAPEEMGAALELAGACQVERGDTGNAAIAVVSGAPLAGAVRLALRELVQVLAAGGANASAAVVHDAARVVAGAPGLLGPSATAACKCAGTVVVLEDHCTRTSELVASVAQQAHVGVVPGRSDRATAQRVTASLAGMLATSVPELAGDPRAVELLLAVAAAEPAGARAASALAARQHRRGARLARPLPEPVAAGLLVAQAALGVPVRIDEGFPSWRAETGACLTVVDVGAFARSGVEVAAPEARSGAFVLVGPADSQVHAAVAAAGAIVEVVDRGRPRAIGRAVAGACRGPGMRPHVILLAEGVGGMVDDRLAGVDEVLLGSDRIAGACLPEGSVRMAARPLDELATGTVLEVRDPRLARTALPSAADLSPAWYDVRARPARGWLGERRRDLRRRMLRMVAGVAG